MIRVLLAIDGAAALVILYFFFIGLADGTVSARNAGLWLGTLAALVAILGGGYALTPAAGAAPPSRCCSCSPFRRCSTACSCWR